MLPETRLWQAVVLRALLDATARAPRSNADRVEKARAHGWIKRRDRGFVDASHLAGLDPDFIRDAYMKGKVSPEGLRRVMKGGGA